MNSSVIISFWARTRTRTQEIYLLWKLLLAFNEKLNEDFIAQLHSASHDHHRPNALLLISQLQFNSAAAEGGPASSLQLVYPSAYPQCRIIVKLAATTGTDGSQRAKNKYP